MSRFSAATGRRFALVIVLLGRTSLAEERGPTVTFSGPEAECPAPAYVDERVGRLLGSGERGRGAAQVLVTKSANGYDAVVAVQTKDGRGERHFSANTCQLAADTAAVIVAISLFPERAGELAGRASETDVPIARPSTGAANAGAAGAQPSVRFAVAAGGALDTSSLPFAALGIGAGFDVRVGTHLVFDLSAAGFLPQTVHQTDTRGARFDMLSGGLRGCYAIGSAEVEGGPCIGVNAVRVAGHGEGTDRTYDRLGLYVGPSAGAMFRWKLSSTFGLRICAEAFFPVARRPFLLDGLEIHRPPSVGATAFLGPDLFF